MIGPYDLSASLGKPGEINHPVVQSAIERIIDACQAATISMGIFGINAEAVLPYKEKGFNLLAVGIDTAFLISSAKDTLIKMKD